MAYLVPDMPRKLREQVRRENYLTNEIILKVELEIAKGNGSKMDPSEMMNLRRRIQSNIFAFGKAKQDEQAATAEEATNHYDDDVPVVRVRDGGGETGGGDGGRPGVMRGPDGGWNGSTTMMTSNDNVFDESNV